MSRQLAVILALAASTVVAQVIQYGVQSDGSKLPTRPLLNFTGGLVGCADDRDGGRTNCSLDGGSVLYQSTGALNLYVNGEWGNDSNTCLGADAGAACLTIQGALSKLPFAITAAATVNVAGLQDGGILDYAGYYLPHNLQRYSDAGTPSLTIQGVVGAAPIATGPNQANWTSCDAGGGTTNYDQFASVTVAGAGWTDGGLRGYFVEYIRPDGGVFGSPVPVQDNSGDIVFPSYQVPATNCTNSNAIRISQPLTRITGTNPRSSVVQVTLDGPANQNVTISRFDYVSATRDPFAMVRPGTLTASNSRFFYGRSGGSIFNAQAGQVFGLSNSVAWTTGANQTFQTFDSTASVTLSVVYVNGTVNWTGSINGPTSLGGGAWNITNSSFIGTRYGGFTTGNLTPCNNTLVTFSANRVIGETMTCSRCVEYGFQARCASGGSFNGRIGNNYFANILYDAVRVQGGRNIIVAKTGGSKGTSISGYGIRIESGGASSFLSTDVSGTAGDAILEGVPYPRSFLTTIPTFSVDPLYGALTSKCLTNTTFGSQVCSD